MDQWPTRIKACIPSSRFGCKGSIGHCGSMFSLQEDVVGDMVVEVPTPSCEYELVTDNHGSVRFADDAREAIHRGVATRSLCCLDFDELLSSSIDYRASGCLSHAESVLNNETPEEIPSCRPFCQSGGKHSRANFWFVCAFAWKNAG